jgi:SAM-dependent methyltransferase
MYTILAEYYDCIYSSYLSKVPSIIDSVEKIFRTHSKIPVRRVLDLACGTGGPTIELARRGYEVVGVDVNEEVLRIAEAKSRAAGVNIRLVRMDMKSLDLGEVFDAATIFFTSIQYIGPWGELTSFLKKLRKHVKTGGVVVFDAGNPLYPSAAEGRPIAWDVLCENGDRLFLVDYHEVDPLAQTLRFKRLVHVMREGKLAKAVLVDDLLYLYTVNEYRLALERAGFEVAAVYRGYGDLRGCPSDRRIVAVARAV